MRVSNFKISAAVLTTLVLSSLVAAQQPVSKNENPDCSIATYSGKQVDKKVKILAKPEPRYDKKELQKSAPGEITLKAIFCGSGEVTDIKVQSGLSDGLNEKAVEAAKKIRFVPAEKDGVKVSQVLIVKYLVNL